MKYFYMIKVNGRIWFRFNSSENFVLLFSLILKLNVEFTMVLKFHYKNYSINMYHRNSNYAINCESKKSRIN